MRHSVLALMIVGSLGPMGCRGGSSGGGGGGGDGGGGGADASGGNADAAPPQTIKSVRMNQPADGTGVSFKNVVVTARVTSSKYGHVWVQDQGGGQYSGIQLFCNYGGSNPSCSMTRDQIDALNIGDVVDVSGSFSSFLLNSAPAGAQPVLEIDAPMVTSTGNIMSPTAVDVDAATVAKDQLAAAAAEPYKGAYVHVTGSATVTNVMATEYTRTCQDMSQPPQTGTTYGGFEVDHTGQTLALGLNFYATVTYCLPCSGVPMPYACDNPVTNGTMFTAVSGIVEPDYNSNGEVYLQVSPTADTDLPQ